MKHIFFLNGPPRSGKDTAGDILRDMLLEGARFDFEVRVDKFARALKERTHALYGLINSDGSPWPHNRFESCKDQPNSDFLGLTPRQAYIAVSERLMKPMHGADIFGKLLAQLIPKHIEYLIVTDSGFVEEALALLAAFPQATATLIRLHRKGCDFSGDSRGHIDLSACKQVVDLREVYNDADISQLRACMDGVARRVKTCLASGDWGSVPTSLPWSDPKSDPLGDMRRIDAEIQRELDFEAPREGGALPPEDSPLLGA